MVMSDGRLRLDLVTARVGRLPLPLRAILSCLPRDVFHSGNYAELDLTGPTPGVCLHFSDNEPESPSVKSIKCTEGVITIEFLAPVLKSRHDERSLASSRRD
jgi:hypothetical protein